MPYICPICQNPLMQHQPSQGYYCSNKHHFDRAAEGYLNLLPVQHKKSKEPGDSRAMMRARRHFLETGFYQPLSESIATLLDANLSVESSKQILDMGCGEGYYSRQIENLCQNSKHFALHGIDIAKNAIFAAAKKQPNAHFIVASNKRMPYKNAFFDCLLRIYAPSNDDEIIRLLKEDGLLLIVTPGPRHLWQLKEFIYKKVNEHDINISLPKQFEQIETQRIQFNIKPDQENRMALLQMTPFAWRAKAETKNQIQRAQGLEIETDFILTLARKQHSVASHSE
ncbi:MAG: 23S rRNA (guanine(745)-N(1))-methyltransferase [Methylococcales bacterium]|nr:23S rRNA (guanine(745)-N(1))-methyltransferase [Methylococcaceae bacterium]